MDSIVLSEIELKGVQTIEKDVLAHFVQICEKYNFKYFITYGTLIGVVRHKGFIPWDDDIDVFMPRNDYDEFNRVASAELPDYLFLQNRKTDPEYLGGFTKIRNSNTTFIETNYMYKKMNQGIYIDIFPLDYCPSTRLGNLIMDCKKKLLFLRTRSEIVVVEDAIRHKKCISGLIQLASYILKLFYPNIDKMFSRTEKYLRNIKDNDCVCNFYAYVSKYRFPKAWFKDGIQMKFEDIDVIAPENYDAFLKYLYDDYMKLPPEKDRATRHFVQSIDCNKSYVSYLNKL